MASFFVDWPKYLDFGVVQGLNYIIYEKANGNKYFQTLKKSSQRSLSAKTTLETRQSTGLSSFLQSRISGDRLRIQSASTFQSSRNLNLS